MLNKFGSVYWGFILLLIILSWDVLQSHKCRNIYQIYRYLPDIPTMPPFPEHNCLFRITFVLQHGLSWFRFFMFSTAKPHRCTQVLRSWIHYHCAPPQTWTCDQHNDEPSQAWYESFVQSQNCQLSHLNRYNEEPTEFLLHNWNPAKKNLVMTIWAQLSFYILAWLSSSLKGALTKLPHNEKISTKICFKIKMEIQFFCVSSILCSL